MNETEIAPNASRKWFFQVLTLGVVFAFFLLPIIFNGGLGPERAQWNAAQAIRLYELGDKQQAIELLTEAASESEDPLLDLQLADWHQQLKDYDSGIAICDSILKRFGIMEGKQDPPAIQHPLTEAEIKVLRGVIVTKANCLICKGQKNDALQLILDSDLLYNNLDRDGILRRKNELAYYRAVCGQGLVQARDEIGFVFNELSKGGGENPVRFTGEVCYAVGLVSRYTDQRKLAVETLSERIGHLKEEYDGLLADFNGSHYMLMSSFVPLDQEKYQDSIEKRQRYDLCINELATLRSVKALLLEELGQENAASDERHRVAELGQDAEAILKGLPSDRYCLYLLKQGATYLDTKGYVRAGWNDSNGAALRDLNLAVVALDVLLASEDTSLPNSAELDFSWYRELPRTAAVIRYHRMQIYIAESCPELAAQEKEKIVALGFEPGDDLF